jgi:hydroxymethylbilane synthase
VFTGASRTGPACIGIEQMCIFSCSKETSLRKEIRIGTRASALALWQAEWVKAELESKHPGMRVSLTKIKTTGDKILDVPLAKVGGKGLFVKEIEEAMLRNEIDIAVHSMKDVPTFFPDGLHLGAITKREDPRDALLSRNHVKFKDLPVGAKVGTSSLRRQAQLMHVRPDFLIEQLRGNVDTRLRKLREGQYDAIILAAAGVRRLGLAENVTEYLETEVSLPAIGQGALGIECRADDRELNDLIAFFNHADSRVCVTGERALLRRLEGGCQVPIACYGQVRSGGLMLTGLVASVDGKTIIKDVIEGPQGDAERLGVSLAENLLRRGADVILREVYGKNPDYSGDRLLEN